ncbi:hypothetical protein ACP4J4_14650 [Aureimonas ureilytica]|uniref:hypothetical protein n=1 Tax=Aureimonas ureilytica TaxID=401562 RepID=UPI003CE7526A
MKTFAIASAAVLSLVAFTSVSSAAGLVPGSDYYEDVQADHAANTVIAGQAAARGATVNTVETRSFGYPVGVSANEGVVPGSRTTVHADETAQINAVSKGVYNNGATPASSISTLLVPGSDSF